jgi:hypothetical protein
MQHWPQSGSCPVVLHRPSVVGLAQGPASGRWQVVVGKRGDTGAFVVECTANLYLRSNAPSSEAWQNREWDPAPLDHLPCKELVVLIWASSHHLLQCTYSNSGLYVLRSLPIQLLAYPSHVLSPPEFRSNHTLSRKGYDLLKGCSEGQSVRS